MVTVDVVPWPKTGGTHTFRLKCSRCSPPRPSRPTRARQPASCHPRTQRARAAPRWPDSTVCPTPRSSTSEQRATRNCRRCAWLALSAGPGANSATVWSARSPAAMTSTPSTRSWTAAPTSTHLKHDRRWRTGLKNRGLRGVGPRPHGDRDADILKGGPIRSGWPSSSRTLARRIMWCFIHEPDLVSPVWSWGQMMSAHGMSPDWFTITPCRCRVRDDRRWGNRARGVSREAVDGSLLAPLRRASASAPLVSCRGETLAA